MAAGCSQDYDLSAAARLTSCSSPNLAQQDSSAWLIRSSMRSSSAVAGGGQGVSLPPLRCSGEQLEACLDQCGQADSSPLRRTRKAELISCVLGHSPGSQGFQAGLLLELELKEQQLASKQRIGRIVPEGWVNDVLTNSNPPQQQQHHGSSGTGAVRGAAAAGLARQQLLAAGLSSGSVDHLYRCLYVYSMGFVDSVKELLGSNAHRQELLPAIWQAFLVLAEHCMKATFKSEYLQLVTAAGTAVTELLCTKQTLSVVTHDNAVMVKDLGSLSAAEAEASAQRRSLKAQVEELRTALATEQTAHRRAVQQYVDALDARSDMQLQCEATQQAFSQLMCAHQELEQQHEQLQRQHADLLSQCRAVRDVCRSVDSALALDPQLQQQVQQWQQGQNATQPPQQEQQQEEEQQQVVGLPDTQQQQQQQQPQTEPSHGSQQQPGDADDSENSASDLQALAQRLDQQVQAMYGSWRSAVNARDTALTQRYQMVDQLREAEEGAYQMQQQHDALQRVLAEVQQQLEGSQAEAADLGKRLSGAHQMLAQCQLDLGEAEGQLQHSRNKATALDSRCCQLEETVERLRDERREQQADRLKLETQLTAAAQRLGHKHRLMAELSKGFAVAMQSLAANQTARAVSNALLTAERAKGAHMNSSLNSKDRVLHDLQAQVRDQANHLSKLQSEASLLESSLQDSQRQAMALGTRLALTETKNDELLVQTQTQLDQLADAATKATKLATRLDQSKQQLERANKEINSLKEAAQVSERIISDGRLLSKSLAADVERLTREKQVAQERAETTKARLELEVQRQSGELTACERKLELLGADLSAERDRVAAQAALLERKRGRKRHWKEAYHSSSDEVAALHTQLLAQHKNMEALESRLRQLHTELALLSIGTTTTTTASSAAGRRGGQQRSPRSRPGTAGHTTTSRPSSAHPPGSSPSASSSRPTSAAAASPAAAQVDLAEARRAHTAAAERLGEVQAACQQLDQQMEALEVELQQVLLGFANPSLSSQHIKAQKLAVAEQRTRLQDLRQQRSALNESRVAAAEDVRRAEAVLRDAHHARLQQRQQLLEQQAVKACDLVNAAAMAQLAAAEEAEEAARAALSQQLAAQDGLHADKAALAQRMQELQAGIDTFMARISGLEGDKAALDEHLRRTQHMVTCLQAEVSAVNAERERIRNNASQAEQRIAALENELETAKQAVTLALKGMEAKHAAERQLQEQRLVAERSKASKAAAAADAAVSALRARITQLRAALAELSAVCFSHGCVNPGDKLPLLDRDSSSGSGGGSGFNSSGGGVVPPLPLLVGLGGGGSSNGGGVSEQQGFASSTAATARSVVVRAEGQRWLYMHLPGSPWVRVRQLLLQPLNEGPEGLLMRQSSSVPPTPRGGGGGSRLVGLPPSLPGLAFNLEGLLILVAELLLHKIDSDTASDDRMLMCAAAASAGMCTASSSTASSRTASRPATASQGGVGAAAGASAAGSTGSSGGSGSSVTSAAGGASAAAAAAGALLGVVAEEEGVGGLKGGSAAAVAAWWATRFRSDMEGAVFEFFLTRCGSWLLAEAHCSALVLAIRKAAPRNKRVSLFGRCLGLLEPAVPSAGVGVLLHFLAQLHSTCGPLVTEAKEGSSQVLARTAAQLAMQVLQPISAHPTAEVSGLTAAITSAAGGSSDNAVETDAVLELLAAAWSSQRAAEQQQLERLVAQSDAPFKGLANQEEFAGLVKQVAPAVGHHLHQEQLSWLFSAALAVSGPGATAVTPAGFAAAVLDAGLAGSAAHLRRHPTIKQRPGFSDYRLLTTSWQAVKPSLKEVLRVLPKAQPALAPEVSTLNTLVHKLDEALAVSGGLPAAEAWQLYRRILGFYALYGSFPEACSVPSTPRPGMDGGSSSSSLSGATPRSARAEGSHLGYMQTTSASGGV